MKKAIAGNKYKCILDLIPYYIKGKVYESKKNKHIVDEFGNTSHSWSKKGMKKHFKEVKFEACGIETEPEYVITESQIKELYELTGFESNVNNKLRQFFPDVVKDWRIEIKAGTWYKSLANNGSLFEYLGNGQARGFFQGTDWIDEWNYPECSVFKCRLATTEEVTEALTKEAVKRYKVGDYVGEFLQWNQGTIHKEYKQNQISDEEYKYNDEFNYLFIGNLMVFDNGKWIKIIPTISKEDAEKHLNKKII